MFLTIKNRKKIEEKLIFIYGAEKSKKIIMEIEKLLDRYHRISSFPSKGEGFLSEKDVAFITYADNFRLPGERALLTLKKFLKKYFTDTFSLVHLLPFYPYSSDDGFSVIDYRKVNSALGDWDDIKNIGKNFGLVFDAVVNHVSSESHWFKEYLRGNPEYEHYFIKVNQNTDTSCVVRARAHPLFTKFKCKGEEVYLWTTFSADQIDLNYKNEKVLLEIIELLLFYATKNARIIRLDAIGHTWKRIGTSCLNLEEVHKIVQLFRTILDEIFPHVLLLTETNVPYQENIKYLGENNNEAQLIYQFPLPLLVLYTFHTGNATRLAEWAKSLIIYHKGKSYFNLLASHDGIGVRPVKGILTDKEINELVDLVQRRGGFVSYVTTSNNQREAYELNITYYDAIAEPENSDDLNIKKFIAAQSILLSFVGVPGIYVHSLFGTDNYLEGVKNTGQKRTINRKKFEVSVLERELSNERSKSYKVFTAFQELIKKRRKEKAFHPCGDQKILNLITGVFSFIRMSPDGQEKVVVLNNITGRKQELLLPEQEDILLNKKLVDIISGSIVNIEEKITLAPYQIMWLKHIKNKSN
ncbi:MAG: Putative sucrose phosphorylase [Atribacteria bacterium 34_868]|nr:MAG: Putative sucrose phosphorylase [Atribacteria bacterium 34_868]